MEREQLERVLRSVGMRVFVEHFDQFANPGLTVGQLADRLPRGFTAKARATRASHARRIFRAGLEREALALIAASGRVGRSVAERARDLGRAGR